MKTPQLHRSFQTLVLHENPSSILLSEATMLIANKKEEVKKFNFHLLVAMIEMAEISDPSSEVEDMLLYNSF